MLPQGARVTCYPRRRGVALPRRKIPQRCQRAKGEGDEDGEFDPTTQSRKALVYKRSRLKLERAQVLQRCAAWVWPLSLGAGDLICG